MQLVADVQNAAAFTGKLTQHHKQLLHRLRCEHRGGLVQDEQLRVGQQSADDFHALHLAHAQCVHGTGGVNVEAVLRGGVGDALGHLGEGERLVQAQPHVLGHAERVKQAEVLKHHADAQTARLLRVADVDHLAVEANLARIGLDRAVDDLHQRGFARAVLAQHRVNFAGLHRQADGIVGHHSGVALGDVGKLQAGVGHGAIGYNTNMARKSFTLVCVGPVTTKSPTASKKP